MDECLKCGSKENLIVTHDNFVFCEYCYYDLLADAQRLTEQEAE